MRSGVGTRSILLKEIIAAFSSSHNAGMREVRSRASLHKQPYPHFVKLAVDRTNLTTKPGYG